MPRLVIIDDDIQLLEILTLIIGQYIPVASIFTANDGLEGMELVKNQKPDLILLDINLPLISGHTICKQIKADPELQNIPVLIITGESSDTDAKVKSLESGAEAFLRKPFDTPELIAQIKSLLRLKRAEDELREERDLLRMDVKLKEKELEKNYRDIKQLFGAFIEVMATAIDALSIYNYDSTRRVAEMVGNFVSFIRENDKGRYKDTVIDEEKQENLIIAAWLHDIGKISIPTQLMNKHTRLGEHYSEVIQRLDTIYYYLKLEKAEPALIEKCRKGIDLVTTLNNPMHRSEEEDIDLIRELSELTYIDSSGKEKCWLLPEEVKALTIREGTLTENERRQIEKHVKMTDLLLSKVPFPYSKRDIREWCNNHHELLDGSGYYRGLKGEQISIETRILTIVDIFEALTSSERVYKKHYSEEEALAILKNMAEQGKLDKGLVELFSRSSAWKEA